jgi:hypothetical protein
MCEFSFREHAALTEGFVTWRKPFQERYCQSRVKVTSGAHDEMLATVRQSLCCLWGALSDERTIIIAKVSEALGGEPVIGRDRDRSHAQ